MIAPVAAKAACGIPAGQPINAEVESLVRQLDSANAAYRRVQARFDAAQTTDENSRHWANADSLGPNAALDAGTRCKIRNRARYEIANDTFARGMIDTLANDTVGTGPALQLIHSNRDAAREVESLFWRWMVAIKLPSKLRTMRKAKAPDGNAFASMFTNPRIPGPVKLDIRLHEDEQIDDTTAPLINSPLSSGIYTDELGNVVGYSLLKEHPGEYYHWRAAGPNDAVFIPARYMIHMFNADRPGQIRGVSEIASALPLFAMRRRYSLAVLRAAENAALNSGILKTQAPVSADDVSPLDAIDLERGMYTTLPKGWELTQLKAEQPTSTFDMFQKAIIREIARCLNMPFNVAAGDSSGYNYSSGRMDHQVYWKSIAVERSIFELEVLDRLFAEWWLEAIRIPDYLPAIFQHNRAFVLEAPEHNWRWDGREHVDPTKEATAQTIRLTNGTTHRRAEYTREGRDIDEEDAIAARDLGISVSEYRQSIQRKLLGVSVSSPVTSEPEEDGHEQ